jgi:hypothetical protein
MHVRLVFVLSLLVIVPAFSQQSPMQQKIQQRYSAHDNNLRPEAIPEMDQRAMRQKAIFQDVAELSDLSASLQSDLQQLQKGMLARDLNQKLKKVEKLSKRLRQEISQ